MCSYADSVAQMRAICIADFITCPLGRRAFQDYTESNTRWREEFALDAAVNTAVLLFYKLSRSGSIRVRFRSWSWFLGMMSFMLVTAIWGYSNIVIHQGEAAISPAVLLWMRFAVAGVVMLPVVLRLRLSRRDWLFGLGTGAVLGLSVLAQGWAMMTVPVDEVAFITALYVVFTPLGASLLHRMWPPRLVWFAVGLSLVGMTLLIGRLSVNLHIGILWAMVAALGISVQIIATTSLVKTVSSVQLAGLQSEGAAITLTLAVMIQGAFYPSIYAGLFHWTPVQWFWIGYLAIAATVVAVFLQSWGQARISATEAALAFNMEPVWTALFALAVLSQGMTAAQVTGAALIVGSLSAVSGSGRSRNGQILGEGMR